jgi:hypothetical protein
MRKTMPYLGLAVMVASLVISYQYLAYQDLSFLGFEQQSEGRLVKPSLWRMMFLIVSTLLGITSGYFHSRLQTSAVSRFIFTAELKEMFYSPDYYRGLFASPIVFSVVYVAVNQQPDDVIAFLLAFENGFFWNRVLEKRMNAI